MATISVRIDQDVYQEVIERTQKTGGKIGKFFELAAREKLEREADKKPKKFKPNYETK